MSVVYRERDREWDDSRTAISSRRDGGGYTTVKRYRIGGDDDVRSAAYDRDRRDTRIEETRIVRREREPSPEPQVERKITIRREREEPRVERDIVIRRERDYEEPRRDYRREEPVVERDLVVRRREERDEPRYEERDISIRRYDDRRDDRNHPYDRNYDLAPPQDLTRYSRSTEYFSQPQQPQTIIIKNEPIVIRERVRDDSDFQMVRREDVDDRTVAKRSPPANRDDEEYFYERRIQETQGRRDKDSEYAEGNRYRRDVSPGDSISQAGRRGRDQDYSSDDSMVYVRKEVRETSRDRSESPHHRRHVAEGALAGIGVAELLRQHSKKKGKEQSGPLARVGKDVGGGVLGIIAAEGLSRARSRMRSKSRGRGRDDSRDSGKSRRRSRSESHSRLKTLGTVGLGAAALAVAAAVARNRNKSPERRSRSRVRRGSDSGSEVSANDARNPSHRNKRMAEAGLAGAAVAGLIERARSKSRKGDGKERSRSRVRTALPIAAAGLGSAAIAGLYEKNRAKREEAVATANRERKSRSRSRSRARSTMYSDTSRGNNMNDPSMIEYGNDPVYGAIPQQGYYGQPAPDNYYDNAVVPAEAAATYGAARGERSRSRSRSRDRRRSVSSGSSDGQGRRRRHRKHRSRSQSRDLATAGVAAAGGALAASEYQRQKEQKRQAKAEKKERRRREAEQAQAQAHGQDHYEEGFEAAPYPQPPQDQFYPQTNQFPPPPGAVPTEYPAQPMYSAPQPPYTAGEYQQPPTNIPPVNPTFNGQPYPGTPGVPPANPYAGHQPRGEENVSAVPPTNTDSFPNENYQSVDGLSTPRASSPQQQTGHSKSVKFTPSVIGESSPERRRQNRHGEGNRSYEADDSDTTLDDDDRRRANPRSTFSRRPTGFANDASSTNPTSSSSATTNTPNGTSKRPRPRQPSPTAAPSPAPSDETIELPERFDEKGRPKPEKDVDPIAGLVEGLLNGKGFLDGDGSAGEGSSKRDRRRR